MFINSDEHLFIESQTIDDFALSLHLTSQDLENLKIIFLSIEQGDLGILSAIGIKVRQNNVGKMKT